MMIGEGARPTFISQRRLLAQIQDRLLGLVSPLYKSSPMHGRFQRFACSLGEGPMTSLWAGLRSAGAKAPAVMNIRLHLRNPG